MKSDSDFSATRASRRSSSAVSSEILVCLGIERGPMRLWRAPMGFASPPFTDGLQPLNGSAAEHGGKSQHQFKSALPRDTLSPLRNRLRAYTEKTSNFYGGAAKMLQHASLREHGEIKAYLSPVIKHPVYTACKNAYVTIGQRIKERRRELSLEVKDLASACGVTPQAVYQWEAGDSKGLKPENLVTAAEFLRVTPSWLALGKLPKEPPTAALAEQERAHYEKLKRMIAAFREEDAAAPRGEVGWKGEPRSHTWPQLNKRKVRK